jgi:hypothetical protein
MTEIRICKEGTINIIQCTVIEFCETIDLLKLQNLLMNDFREMENMTFE